MRSMLFNGKRRRWAFVTLGLVVVVCVGTAVGFTLAGGRPAHASGSGDGGLCPQGWDGTPSCHVKGFTAAAGVNEVDTSTCADGVYIDVQVNVFDGLTHALPGPATTTQYAMVSIGKYDNCTGTSTFYFGDTTSPDLQVTGQTDGATLHATIPTTSYYTGEEGPTFTVDVTWKGVGDVYKVTTNTTRRNGNSMTKLDLTGDDRSALTNGSITDGTSTYVIAAVTDINYAKSGALAISHA